jgi:hypothetical protein
LGELQERSTLRSTLVIQTTTQTCTTQNHERVAKTN